MQRMAAAMAYHREHGGRGGQAAESTGLRGQVADPRLYTEDKYCASFSVDYFHGCRFTTVGHSCFLRVLADHSGDSQEVTGRWTCTQGCLVSEMFKFIWDDERGS